MPQLKYDCATSNLKQKDIAMTKTLFLICLNLIFAISLQAPRYSVPAPAGAHEPGVILPKLPARPNTKHSALPMPPTYKKYRPNTNVMPENRTLKQKLTDFDRDARELQRFVREIQMLSVVPQDDLTYLTESIQCLLTEYGLIFDAHKHAISPAWLNAGMFVIEQLSKDAKLIKHKGQAMLAKKELETCCPDCIAEQKNYPATFRR
jgi:hypothetical protein